MDTEPLPVEKPQGQVKKTCGAKTRSGGRCIQTMVAANGRCRMHGGATPAGLASPHFRTGRWSKHLPAKSLGRGFEAAYNDRTLMQLRQDAALVDALLTSVTGNLKDTGRPLPLKQEQRVLALLEQRRKIVESEARRLRDLSQVVPIDQYRTALAVMAGLLRQYLADNPAAVRDIHQAAQRLLLGRGLEPEGGGE